MMIPHSHLSQVCITSVSGNHWVQRATGIKYVSAGVTGVWGININDPVVYRGYDDTSFTPVSGMYYICLR